MNRKLKYTFTTLAYYLAITAAHAQKIGWGSKDYTSDGGVFIKVGNIFLAACLIVGVVCTVILGLQLMGEKELRDAKKALFGCAIMIAGPLLIYGLQAAFT